MNTLFVGIDAVRALILASLFLFLWRKGRKELLFGLDGWWQILTGVLLVTLGAVLEVAEYFPALNGFVVIGNTPVAALLARIVGYLGGCILIFIGLLRWIPLVKQLPNAESSLQQAEAKYLRLHESMADAYVMVDMTGRLIDFNPSYRDMLGYSEEELQRTTYIDLTPEKWRALEARIVMEQIIPRGQSDVYEKEYIRKDGTLFPVELRTFLLRSKDGQPEAMWAIVRDITERNHKDSLFNSFLENSQIIAWILNSQHRYAFVSDNFLRRFSVPREGILGKTHHEVWPKEMADQFAANDMRLWTQGGSIEVVEHATQPSNSWWLSHKFIFNDPKEGRMIGGLAVNITERIEQEQQRIDKEMEHRKTLVREVHHRIKNNLQSVTGLLHRELGKFASRDPRLESAISQVNSIAVIHGLQGSNFEEQILLSDIARNICASIADLSQHQVMFQLDGTKDSFRSLEINKEEAVPLALVLNELILNAVKHSPQDCSGPTLSISRDGASVTLVIRNAVTTAPDFDIDSGKGIGTGLSLVRSLMPLEGAQLSYALKEAGFLLTQLKLSVPVIAASASDVRHQ